MKKLLVVDDDVAFLNAMLKYLESDYDVLVADHAAGGIALFLGERPDISVIDVSMPGMNGIELLEVLRRYWPQAQIIVVSGADRPEARSEALRLGAVDYLPKPLSLETLCEVIDYALMRGRRKNAV